MSSCARIVFCRSLRRNVEACSGYCTAMQPVKLHVHVYMHAHLALTKAGLRTNQLKLCSYIVLSFEHCENDLKML